MKPMKIKIIKPFKTLNNAYCWDIIRLACQCKWRFVAFALYNHEPRFSDDIKGRLWSILSRCSYDDDLLSGFREALLVEEYSLMAPSLNRYFDCYIKFLGKL